MRVHQKPFFPKEDRMLDLVAIARRFISEQMRERDDILGAYIGGSAARGDATEVSDVDVTLVVADKGQGRVEIGGWVQGTFIDAGLKPREALSSIERVMEDHVGSTILRDALILHDPTGFLADLQAQVRARYMEPARVQARINDALQMAKGHVSELGEAVATDDPLHICEHLWPILWGAVLVPLLRLGVAPSATRIMVQLGEIDRALSGRGPRLPFSRTFTDFRLGIGASDSSATADLSFRRALADDRAFTSSWPAEHRPCRQRVRESLHHLPPSGSGIGR